MDFNWLSPGSRMIQEELKKFDDLKERTRSAVFGSHEFNSLLEKLEKIETALWGRGKCIEELAERSQDLVAKFCTLIEGRPRDEFMAQAELLLRHLMRVDPSLERFTAERHMLGETLYRLSMFSPSPWAVKSAHEAIARALPGSDIAGAIKSKLPVTVD